MNVDQGFARLFRAAPSAILVVKPDTPRFTIAEVNDAYLLATMRTRDELLGRGIFEAFPDNPGDDTIAGVSTLRASLERVLASHRPDALPVLKYDIARPDGTFEDRWWRPVNSAVLGEDGQIEAILHTATDVTQASRAEAALLASEDRLRGVLDSMSEGFALLDHAFTIVDVNDATVQLDGRPRHELIGRSHWEAFPGSEESLVGEALKRVSRERTAVSLEHEYRWRDGRSMWIELRAYPTGHAGVAIFWRDVTAHVEAAAALRASQDRLRRALDAAELGAWNADPATDTLRADDRFLAIFHSSTDPLTYEQALATIHPDDRQRVIDAVAAACRLDDPTPYSEEYRVVHPDGTVHWVFVRGRATFADVAGGRRFVTFDGTALDVTDRKRQEQEIADSQRTLYAIVERCPFGIYIVDDAFRIASVNAGSQDKAFANVRPLIGRPLDDAMRVIWPEPVVSEIIDIFRRTLDTGEPYRSSDFVSPRADIDETEGYEWELHRVMLPNGRHGVVCYYYDSTRLRHAEWELREADRRKDEFLATLAHELRNPLAPIRNGLQIMKLAGGDVRAVEKSRGMMERQVGQMVHLIDDLMDLSRVSRGKIDLLKTRFALTLTVQDAVDTARSLIDERGHELLVDVPAYPIDVDADRTRLAQVFGNLLNNAAKYTERGGRIRIAVERQGSSAVVTVQDNGIGIPPDMLDKVFDMFAQVDYSLEKSRGGLGIGLNIVRKLVEMHHGSVVAESGGPGTGCRFVVRLPLAPTVTIDAEVDHGGASPGRPARRRILVVDDNLDAADSVATMLEMMGNETQVSRDGLEAVAMAEASRPDVILMDIGMPRLNGYDACRRIREMAWSRNTVIVALTGWGQEGDKLKSRDAGFDFHMVKPVDPGVLEKLLTRSSASEGGAPREVLGPDGYSA